MPSVHPLPPTCVHAKRLVRRLGGPAMIYFTSNMSNIMFGFVQSNQLIRQTVLQYQTYLKPI